MKNVSWSANPASHPANTLSAIKVRGGKIYSAPTHCQAYAAAEAAGEAPLEVLDWGFLVDGLFEGQIQTRAGDDAACNSA